MIVLDASVLIAFLDPADDLHRRSRAALSAPDVVDAEWIVPTTVCAEMLVGAYRAGSDAVELVDRFLNEAVDRIEPATLDIARRAASIRSDNARLSLVGAFVLATGEIVGAELTLTSDRAWKPVSDRVRVI